MLLTPALGEAETGGFQVQALPRVHSKVEDLLAYTEKYFLSEKGKKGRVPVPLPLLGYMQESACPFLMGYLLKLEAKPNPLLLQTVSCQMLSLQWGKQPIKRSLCGCHGNFQWAPTPYFTVKRSYALWIWVALCPTNIFCVCPMKWNFRLPQWLRGNQHCRAVSQAGGNHLQTFHSNELPKT